MPGQDDDPLSEVNADSTPVRIAKNALMDEFERPRGIFTRIDRKYLSGFKEYEHKQSESNRRQEIRERVIHAFHDFRLLSWLSERERNKVFNEVTLGKLHDNLVSLLAFVYRGIGRDPEAIEQIVEIAIFRVEAENDPKEGYQGGIADVSVDIDIDHGYDVEKIYERLQQGQEEQLTPAEIGVLVRAGVLDKEEYALLAVDTDQNVIDSASNADIPWYHSSNEQDDT